MAKMVKANSSRKPPEPAEGHAELDDWMRRLMPDLQPIVEQLDKTIRKTYPKAQFAVKWKKAHYGLPDRGWILEIVSYDVSVNVLVLRRRRLRFAAAAGRRPVALREAEVRRRGERQRRPGLDQAGRHRRRLAVTTTGRRQAHGDGGVGAEAADRAHRCRREFDLLDAIE